MLKLLTYLRRSQRTRRQVVALSSLVFLTGLIGLAVIGRNPVRVPILLGTLPVIISGWCLGILAGGASAAVVFGAVAGAALLTGTWDSPGPIWSFIPWIDFFLLEAVGILSGIMYYDHAQITQKSELLDHTQARVTRYSTLLKTIHKHTTSLLKTTSWKENLPDVLLDLGTALRADHAFFLEIPDLTSSQLKARITHSWPDGPAVQHDGSPKEMILDLKTPHLSSWLINAEEGLIITGGNRDLAAEEAALFSLFERGSFAVFPVFCKKQVRGFLGCERQNRGNSWDPLELNLLGTLAHMFNAVITRERISEDLQRRADEINALQETTLRFAGEDQLETILSSILEQIMILFSPLQAEIYLYRGDQFDLLVSTHSSHQPRLSLTTPFSTELMEEVARRKKPLLIPDLEQLPVDIQGNSSRAAALISLPLITPAGLAGILTVRFPEIHPFPESELKLFRLLASQASSAIHNTRLYQQEKDQRSLAEALESTGQIIQSSLNPDDVLDRILAQIERVIPYDTANLMLVENGSARVVRHQGYHKMDPAMLKTVQEQSFDIHRFDTLQKMIETRKPLIISDTRSDPGWVKTQTSSSILSWVGSPIIQDDQVIGFLSLNKFERGFYQPEHGRRIAAFAGQAALALRHAQLYQLEAQRREEAENLRKAQDSLLHISQTIGSSLDFEIISNQVIAYAVEILEVEGVLLFLKDPHSTCYPAYPLDQEVEERMSIPVDELYVYSEQFMNPETSPLIQWLQTARETITISDPQENQLISEPFRKLLNLQSALVSPLITQGQQLGFLLAVSTREDHHFTDYQAKFFSGLADQTSVALERSRLFDEVQKMAETDQLTGVLNRRGLSRWGRYEFERAKRFGRDLSAIFFDLDHFKKINDTYGHETGDMILEQMAERCRSVIRNVDLLARYGGEEFVIILPETDQQTAFRIAERIRKILSGEPYPVNGKMIPMTVSLGVQELKNEYRTLDELITGADWAMYRAKQSGRNQTSLKA